MHHPYGRVKDPRCEAEGTKIVGSAPITTEVHDASFRSASDKVA